MPTLSSPGVGSGLDVTSIVTQLVAIERKPIEQLQAKATAIQTQLSSFGLLQSYVANVRDIAGRLAEPTFWTQTTAASSDASAVTASSTAGAAAGSYSVEVSQLAQSQRLASQYYAGASSVVGSGTLHIQRGGWNDALTAFTADATKPAIDIAIGSGETTLEAIRDKVNAAAAGVTASIVTDAGGSRLSLRSTATGASSALRITVSDADGTNGDAAGLSALAFDPPASARLSQTQAGRDAQATVNGLAVTSASNILAGVVDGVTLTLVKPTTAAVNVQIAIDSGTQRKAIGDFVQAYNDVVGYIAAQTKYDPATKKSAALQGDRATLSLQGTLRGAVQQASRASGAFASLSSIGLETQAGGTLRINESKLSAALAKPAELAKLFGAGLNAGAGVQAADQGYATRLRSLAAQAVASGGVVPTRTQALRDSIQRNAVDQQRYEARVAATKARLTKQYTELDTTVSRIGNTGSGLTQSLTGLANLTAGIASGRR